MEKDKIACNRCGAAGKHRKVGINHLANKREQQRYLCKACGHVFGGEILEGKGEVAAVSLSTESKG